MGKRNSTKIIVSRSHAGDVQKVVQSSLGEDAKVEQAGGAGLYLYQLLCTNVVCFSLAMALHVYCINRKASQKFLFATTVKTVTKFSSTLANICSS